MSARISHISFASVAIVLSLALSLIPQSSFGAVGTFDLDKYGVRPFSPVVRYCTDKINNLPSGWTQVDKCSYSGTTNKYWTTSGPNRIDNNGTSLVDSISGIEVVSGTQTIPYGSYLAIPFLITSGAQELNFSATAGVRYLPRAGQLVYLNVITTEFEAIDSGNYRMTIYARAFNDIPPNTKLTFASAAVQDYQFSGDLNTLFTYNFMWFRGQTRSGIVASNVVAYIPITDDTPSSDADLDDVVDSLGSILGSVNSIRNSINSMSSNQSDILSALQDVQDATIQANDDANDRYQDEKDTISNNGNDAQDSADSLSFGGFSVGNPLLNWISLFTDNTCVSIPTIASWIHSNETSICSPWSSSVRSITTPIISVLSGTVLFGFIVHWLKQKDGQELS